MKRKLIAQLLQDPDPTAHLQELLPATDNKDNNVAREILAVALKDAAARNVKEPQDVYFLVCSSTAEQLMPVLAGTPAEKFSKGQVARGQAILNTLLTSKAGRPASSGLSRKEQQALAQRKRREALKNQEGRKQVNEWINAEAAAYLNTIKEIHGITRAEALEMILLAAFKGQPLPPVSASTPAKEKS